MSSKIYTLDLGDMQGILTRGYNSLNASSYLLFTIEHVGQAKTFFSGLLNRNLVTHANKETLALNEDGKDPRFAVQVAFTSHGIHKLTEEEVYKTFSREFKEGMSFGCEKMYSERQVLLGDTDANHPSNWHWGSNKKVDVLFMLFAANNDALEALKNTVFEVGDTGLLLVENLPNYEYPEGINKEHFGFTDGISQPIIRGLSKDKNIMEDEAINAGEFFLGYCNAYDSYSPSPKAKLHKDVAKCLKQHPDTDEYADLGKNGSYMVFRQMEQDVKGFWSYLCKHSKESGSNETERTITLGAKMVGRWPNGEALVKSGDGNSGIAEKELNQFLYYEEDPKGLKCPFGAHIRRTNPRDDTHAGRDAEASKLITEKHRLLRRGRIYGSPLSESWNVADFIELAKEEGVENTNEAGEETEKRGLHFICLVSDIGRQFEFVQSVWANTPTFANLHNEVDPIIGPRPMILQPACHEFTSPQHLVRNRYNNLPQFTKVVGGAYFFIPGLNALRYLSGQS